MTKSIAHLIQTLNKKISSGVVHCDGRYYVFSSDGTKIYTEKEYEEINGSNNTCKQVSDTDND